MVKNLAIGLLLTDSSIVDAVVKVSLECIQSQLTGFNFRT